MAITNPAPTYEPINLAVTQEQPLLVPNPTTVIMGADTSDNKVMTTPANSIVIGSGSPTR